MWKDMRAGGWSYKSGDGLIAYYYLDPTCLNMSKRQLLKEKVEGVHYFAGEERARSHARMHLGWRTTEPAATPSPGDVELAERVKKRKRGGREPRAEARPVVKKESKKESKKETKKPKKKDQPKKEEQPKKEPKKSDKAKSKAKQVPVPKQQKKSGAKPKAKKRAPPEPVLSPIREEPGSPEIQGSDESRFSEIVGQAGDAVGEKLSFARDEPDDSASASGSTGGSDGGTHSLSGQSSSEQSSLDPTYQVLRSMDAWRLLQDRFGFSYHLGKHCLPGGESRPGKDSCAVEGEDYFSALEDLRANLCARGLPKLAPKRYLSEEEIADLQRWVRYANVVGLEDAAVINPGEIEGLTFTRAWSMLMKLGLKYSSQYVCPDPDPSKPPLKFEQQREFMEHLARFGIPRIDGVQPGVVDRVDRLALDLYIATQLVNTFERIHRGGEDSNKVTPGSRRPRRARSAAAPSGPVAAPAPVREAPARPRAPSRGAYRKEFAALTIQRTFPPDRMGSEEALSILVDGCGFRVLPRGGADGADSYRLDASADAAVPGRDFETLREAREDMCAYGLPPVAAGARGAAGLELWARGARCGARGEAPAGPVLGAMEARATLKGLGYSFIANFDYVLLPGVMCNWSTPEIDRFENLVDLFNHVARFGLETDKNESELTVSLEERSRLEVFAASVATYDVRIRTERDAPVVKGSPVAGLEIDVTAGPAAKAPRAGPNAAARSDAAPTPKQPAVVVDEGDQDTPQSSPPKKVRANPIANPITNFFASTGNATKKALDAALSPARVGARRAESSPAVSSPSASSLGNLSLSCLDNKGDDEIEACFEDPRERVGGTKPDGVPQKLETQFAMSENQSEGADGAGRGASPDDAPIPEHSPQAESPNMSWNDLWAQMRRAGWNFHTGNDSVAWYWANPSAAKMKRGEMLKTCTDGIHYFTTEGDMHRYAKEHLGWGGVPADGAESLPPPPSPSDTSMESRAMKRKQSPVVRSDVSSPAKRRRGPLGGFHGGSAPKQSPPKQESRTSNGAESIPSKIPSKSGDGIVIESQPARVKEYIARPDKVHTVRDKLETCQMVLHASYKTNQMAVALSMEDEIKDFMAKSIQTGTTTDRMTSPSPGFMYICGAPGTGKTTAVASCAQDMKKSAKHTDYDKPKFCFINMAASHNTSCKGGIMGAMLKKVARTLGIDAETNLAVFEKEMKKTVLVLVLDEIDMLFKQHGGIGETWFKTLVNWAENKEMRFSMIGISNCVNDADATRVRDLGHSPRELIFSAYKKEHIVAILEQRLGKRVVDHQALQLISRRVAASSGDVRRALEITSNAVGKCMDSLSDERLAKVVEDCDECLPLVKLPHMMRAIREGIPMRHRDVISGLPQAAKVILCIAVSVSQVWGPTAEISIPQLKTFCVEATHHALMDSLGLGHIMNLVIMLVDSGLLVTGNNTSLNPQDTNAKLKIGVQMDDVEIALEESLLKQGGFYQSLVEYIKRERPHAVRN